MRPLGRFNKLVSQFPQSYYYFGFVQVFLKEKTPLCGRGLVRLGAD
jgi:hypothetical protein